MTQEASVSDLDICSNCSCSRRCWSPVSASARSTRSGALRALQRRPATRCPADQARAWMSAELGDDPVLGPAPDLSADARAVAEFVAPRFQRHRRFPSVVLLGDLRRRSAPALQAVPATRRGSRQGSGLPASLRSESIRRPSGRMSRSGSRSRSSPRARRLEQPPFIIRRRFRALRHELARRSRCDCPAVAPSAPREGEPATGTQHQNPRQPRLRMKPIQAATAPIVRGCDHKAGSSVESRDGRTRSDSRSSTWP